MTIRCDSVRSGGSRTERSCQSIMQLISTKTITVPSMAVSGNRAFEVPLLLFNWTEVRPVYWMMDCRYDRRRLDPVGHLCSAALPTFLPYKAKKASPALFAELRSERGRALKAHLPGITTEFVLKAVVRIGRLLRSASCTKQTYASPTCVW